MAPRELAAELLAWTPFLAGGFAWNVAIAAVAMGLGTLLGMGVARVRFAAPGAAARAGQGVTSLFRNVPSFVLLFYVAFLIPVEITVAGTVIAVPNWLKATIALTIPATAFAADQSLAFLRQQHAGKHRPEAVFWSAWIQYFLIVFMASSTASVIGADEIVARANTVVATHQDATFMLTAYGYVAVWFLLAALLLSRVAPRVVRRFTADNEPCQ